MDGPSVFGAMLDRDAGGFRLGPADTSVPAGRRYLPGTMVLETTWGTRTGWVIVRDVLLIGPWHHERRALAHAPALADRLRRRPRAAAHAALRQRARRDAHGLRAARGLRAHARRLGVRRRRLPQAVGTRRGRATLDADAHAPTCASASRASRARARTTLRDGDTAFVALSWSEHGGPETYDDAYHRLVLHRRLLARVALATASSPTTRGAPTCSAAR